MKTLIMRNARGRTRKVNAESTYQTSSGKWMAEVEGTEFRQACDYLCKGIKDCSCEDLHVQTDQDDDGKEYRVVSRE